jgi:hypothetical protein
MSDCFKMRLGGTPDNGFTIKTTCGCRIVFGEIPASQFAMLTHGFSKNALMATDIADRIGAVCVIGEPADLDELRKLDLPVSEKRHRDYLAAHKLGLNDVAMWLRTGERGLSSNAMCKRIFGVPADADSSHPRDPDDLRRCLLFLDAAKAHDKVSMMADVSPEWGHLVSKWNVIVETFRAEAGGRSAPKTYALLQGSE